MKLLTSLALGGLLVGAAIDLQAQAPAQPPAPAPSPAAAAAPAAQVPAGYVIGAADVLGVVFWREPELSGDVTVRPDGKISLPVIGEIQAAGLAPEALQAQVRDASAKYITDPNVVVVVRTINSRRIFVTGLVATPGGQALVGPLTVLQALAQAGGVTEYADSKNITILRTENGQPRVFKFNYKDVSRGRNLNQNITLLPGDTVVVP
ncbi:MAG: polysaccharide biosynthesis/export family protein [Acidobacteria bacterium]|nr:polysaccharide biosynthesis/export family protein [Acidobacteriota bacterium]